MVFPVVLLMLFAIIQGGFWFHARQVAHHAAQRGVDAQRAYDAAPGAGAAAAGEFLAGTGGSLNAPSVSVSTGGGQVSVEVRGSVITLLPGIRMPVVQRVQAPREEFTP